MQVETTLGTYRPSMDQAVLGEVPTMAEVDRELVKDSWFVKDKVDIGSEEEESRGGSYQGSRSQGSKSLTN
jgi:hypothetical protein